MSQREIGRWRRRELERGKRSSSLPGWEGASIFLLCLLLVGLPPATLYSDPGWSPALAAAALLLAGIGWWRSRSAPPLPVSRGTIGFLVHLPAVEAVEERERLVQGLVRPMESPLVLSLTGGPWSLSAPLQGSPSTRRPSRG